jgi:hypothetical protein
MIINKKIDDAVKILNCFERESVFYWLEKLDLTNSEKGFILFYLGMLKTL